jgi:hypothetical protein
LKHCGLKNIGAMDKVQVTDTSNTAPSSKAFRNELKIHNRENLT